jgi:hypothetical protein
MKKLLLILKKEPLVHFMALGFLLMMMNKYLTAEAENTINITTAELQQHFASIQGDNGPNLTSKDSLDLSEAYIMRQVLFTEATKRGYDAYDPVIMDRMVEKMKASLTEDIRPGAEDLTKYYKENPQRYRIYEGISFNLVSFDLDNQPSADSISVLKKSLQKGNEVNGIKASSFDRQSRFELMRHFGMAFTRTIDALPVKSWEGPVSSSKGTHLVRVLEKHYSDVLPLEAVKAQVMNDYIMEMRALSFQKNYSAIRSKYRIQIDRKK